mmetsp:Transcript_2534/g.3661  ORF Transcript_2534/g.3661 Transcript_2534/m.3661 type:complete len:284 (-) Transcript_2534:575-1426(-)
MRNIRTSDAVAYITLRKNIINMFKTTPKRHVCHEKYLNLGLKFGVPDMLTSRHARLQQAYDKQKNVDIIGAITSRPPINAQSCAIAHVNITATHGSSPFAVPRPNHFVPGKISSRANACNTLEPPKIAPSADEDVDTRIPITTTYSFTHASWKTVSFFIRTSRRNPPPKATINKMYTINAMPTAINVPRPMSRLGSFKSPERLAPSMIPVTAGKMMANTFWKLQVPPEQAESSVYPDFQLSLKVEDCQPFSEFLGLPKNIVPRAIKIDPNCTANSATLIFVKS